jgi:phosphate transport system substrate-binding protein
MRRENRLGYLFILLAIVPMLIIGCKKKTDDEQKTVISVKGSDTMVNLSQKWAEEYMKLHPEVSIQVNGGGSGTGIAALLNKTTEIANASREVKPSEVEDAKSKGVTPFVYNVALDGIAVIVNPKSDVDSLTIKQVSDIFSGKITNWKQVGGANMPITLYGRENSSGTYEFFKEHVLGKVDGKQVDYSPSTQVLQGTSALGEAVARDIKGIGYGGVGYFAERNDVKILHVKKDENSPAYSPSENNKVNYELIWSGDYSISRYLYCYTNGEATGKVKDFMDFILSPEGQKVVETMEYIPLPSKK